jgi:hypothetical protein
METRRPQGPRLIARYLCRSFLETIGNTAVAVSGAFSDALIEAASGPLNPKLRPEGAPANPLQSLPDHIVDRVFGCEPAQRDPRENPVRRIVRETSVFLDGVPGRGGVLTHAVDHVSRITGYEKKQVRSVIVRNFRTRGEVVWS